LCCAVPSRAGCSSPQRRARSHMSSGGGACSRNGAPVAGCASSRVCACSAWRSIHGVRAPYRVSPAMAWPQAARWIRIWCVRPAHGARGVSNLLRLRGRDPTDAGNVRSTLTTGYLAARSAQPVGEAEQAWPRAAQRAGERHLLLESISRDRRLCPSTPRSLRRPLLSSVALLRHATSPVATPCWAPMRGARSASALACRRALCTPLWLPWRAAQWAGPHPSTAQRR
jgi:hypothetical protein